MIIEYDSLLRDAIGMLFESFGARVEGFATQGEGLAALETGSFDMIYCEYELNAGNCASVIERVKALQPEAMLVLVTSCRFLDALLECDLRKIKSCRILVKPIQIEAIYALLDQLMENLRQETDAKPNAISEEGAMR
jgi:DNA-binding NtrC family response regulator